MATSRNNCWKWVIVFAVFIVVMFQLGTFKALGVFVPHFSEHFHINAGTVGLMCGIGGGLKFLLGPLWGALTQVFGYRRITILGGLLAGLAMISIGMSIFPSHLALGMALLSIGMGFPSVAEVMVLHDYFKDDMSVANGYAFTGGAVGMIIFPPLMEYLIKLFGWKTAMMLLGAFSFNVCVAGTLMRRPCNSAYHAIPQTGKHLPRKCKDNKPSIFLDTFLSYLGFSLLSKEPILVMYLAAFSLWGLATSGWVIFLVSYTMTLGYSAQIASALSSFGGIGTLVGRLLTGPFIDSGLISGRSLFCLLSFGSSATLILYPFVHSYWSLVIISFMAGLFVGTPTPVVIVMLKELLPSNTEAFTGAVGLHYFALGLGLLSGGPFTGVIFDITGSFYIAFLTMAAAELLAGLLPLVNSPMFPE